jgi:hypothetical protein
MRNRAPGVLGKGNGMDLLMAASHHISCGWHFGLFDVGLTGNMPMLHVPHYIFIFATTFFWERFESASFFEVASFARCGDEGHFVFLDDVAGMVCAALLDPTDFVAPELLVWTEETHPYRPGLLRPYARFVGLEPGSYLPLWWKEAASSGRRRLQCVFLAQPRASSCIRFECADP